MLPRAHIPRRRRRAKAAAGPKRSSHRSTARRWLGRVALLLLAFAALVTLAATLFDLATAGDERPAQALYHGPFTRVRSTLVAYRRWGDAGSPIVLLGGAAEPTWVWHSVGPLLAAGGHRVLAVDLPPFGYTQRRGPYTMAGWLALLHAFERRLGIRRPLLVGHSLGAGVAAAAALARPREVAGIVLLDGDALAFGGAGWLARLLVYPYYPALYRLATGSDWLVRRVLANAWGPHPPHFDHALLAQFEGPFRVRGTESALRQLAGSTLPGLTLSELRRVRVPAAVVWGQDDAVDALASGRATAAALHVQIRIVPGAGHLSMLARPRPVARSILALAGGAPR